MLDTPDIASMAALVGDTTRAAMLTSLMDGRARTATELALDGDVSPSTASSHLARLTEAGLLAIRKQGRHRYYSIAGPDVAATIEVLMTLAVRSGRRVTRPGPREPELRRARVCYDHLAGEAGVRLLERLREKGFVSGGDDSLVLSDAGAAWCERAGIDVAALRARRRPLCRACLDWSERRTHLAGALGAALLNHMFALRCARRMGTGRAVHLTPRGEAFVEHLDPAR